MIHLRHREETAEFLTIQTGAVSVLNRIADSGGIEGFNDLDTLIDFVNIAEPVYFNRRGMLDITTSSDGTVPPQVLIAKPGNPYVHQVRFPHSKPRLDNRIIDRSKRLEDEKVGGFTQYFVLINTKIVPVFITIKPDKPIRQSAALAHETTHWMDYCIANMDDPPLAEKRAYFVSHHFNRITDSDLYIPDDLALEYAMDKITGTRIRPNIMAAGLVALSVSVGGHTDLSTISDTERELFYRLGAFKLDIEQPAV